MLAGLAIAGKHTSLFSTCLSFREGGRLHALYRVSLLVDPLLKFSFSWSCFPPSPSSSPPLLLSLFLHAWLEGRVKVHLFPSRPTLPSKSPLHQYPPSHLPPLLRLTLIPNRTEHIPNTGHYTWTPPTSITRGDNYTLQLINDKYPDQTSFTPYFLIDSDNLVATVTPVYTYGAPTRAPGEEGAQLLPTATVSPTGGEVVEEATATAAVGG